MLSLYWDLVSFSEAIASGAGARDRAKLFDGSVKQVKIGGSGVEVTRAAASFGQQEDLLIAQTSLSRQESCSRALHRNGVKAWLDDVHVPLDRSRCEEESGR